MTTDGGGGGDPAAVLLFCLPARHLSAPRAEFEIGCHLSTSGGFGILLLEASAVGTGLKLG
jgi:hypothetical protein